MVSGNNTHTIASIHMFCLIWFCVGTIYLLCIVENKGKIRKCFSFLESKLWRKAAKYFQTIEKGTLYRDIHDLQYLQKERWIKILLRPNWLMAYQFFRSGCSICNHICARKVFGFSERYPFKSILSKSGSTL